MKSFKLLDLRECLSACKFNQTVNIIFEQDPDIIKIELVDIYTNKKIGYAVGADEFYNEKTIQSSQIKEIIFKLSEELQNSKKVVFNS
jgi:hypothetical protein